MVVVKKVEKKREIIGYTLSSSYFGKNISEQTAIIRGGANTSTGLSVKAKVIYKKGDPQFGAIEAMSEMTRRKVFRTIYQDVKEVKDVKDTK